MLSIECYSKPQMDERWLQEALKLASSNPNLDLPVGAILVNNDGARCGDGENSVLKKLDPTAHAEIEAIRVAALHTSSTRLLNSKLYVTMHPCLMCLGSIIYFGISEVIYLLPAKKMWPTLKQELYRRLINYLDSPLEFYGGVEEIAIGRLRFCRRGTSTQLNLCHKLLKNYFAGKRD